MPCKVSDSSLTAEPVHWPSLASLPPPEKAPSQDGASSFSAAEVAELRRQLIELEHRKQAEINHGREAAFQDGLRQGREEASAQLKHSAERLAQNIRDLASVKRKLRHEAEIEVVKLSLAIARRILHRELATDPEAIHGLVHAALEKLQNREISRVRVYPAGADTVRSSLESIGAAPAIQVLPDNSLKNGDLIFETTLGELDASVDTQLQEIQRGFADRLSIR